MTAGSSSSSARLWLVLAALVAVASATGCMRRTGTLDPRIVITEPSSGLVARAETIEVRGYALDDVGVRSILVNGLDLMSDPSYRDRQGRKLVPFAFSARVEANDTALYEIEVVDRRGKRTTTNLELIIDSQPPAIALDPIPTPRREAGRLLMRVSGIVRDDHAIGRITVNGTALNFSPGREFAFFLETTRTDVVTIVATDQAGNEATLTRRVPPAPAP